MTDPEMAIFQVANKLLPAAATGLVMAAIMAAIMSTADSLLLQTGTIAARDLYERFINPNASEKQMIWVSRGLVLAIAIIGYFIALKEPPSIFNVVIFTTSVLGSAFLPAYVCAVWWRKANTPGALSSIIAGALTAFFWQYLEITTMTSIAPMVAGVVASTSIMILVSLLTQSKYPVPQNVLELIDESSLLRSIPSLDSAPLKNSLSTEALELERFLGKKK